MWNNTEIEFFLNWELLYGISNEMKASGKTVT